MRTGRLLYVFLAAALLLSSCSDGGTAGGRADRTPAGAPNGTTAVTEGTAPETPEPEAIAEKPAWPDVDYFVSPGFDSCSDMVDGIIQVQKGQDQSALYGLVDENGRMIAEPVYQGTHFYIAMSGSSSGFSEGLAPVRKDGKWGFIDKEGNITIDFRYDEAQMFSEGLSAVSIGGGYGYVDKKGETVIEPQYEEASEFHNGVAVVRKDSKYGFINKYGQWLIRPGYDAVDFGRWEYEWTKSNIVKICKNGYQGYAKTGEGTARVIIEPMYTKLYPFRSGEACFVIQHQDENGNFREGAVEAGYVNEAGKVLYRRSGNGGTDFGNLVEGLRTVENEKGKWGFGDRNFRIVIPCKYDEAADFFQGVAIVKSGGMSGLIDKKGKVLLPTAYDFLMPFMAYGYIIAQQNGQKFLIGTKGYKIISGRYDDIGTGEKTLSVKKNGKAGFIDTSGREISKIWYDECREFDYWGDYAWARTGGKWICIDRNGNEVFSGEFDDVSSFAAGYGGVVKDGKWGVMDIGGNVAVPIEFDGVYLNGSGLARVQYNGKYGYIKLKSRRSGIFRAPHQTVFRHYIPVFDFLFSSSVDLPGFGPLCRIPLFLQKSLFYPYRTL